MNESRRVRRVGPVHAALAVAALGLLVMPLAFAGAKSPEASTSASPKRQIKALSKRIAALEAKQTPAPASPTSLPPRGPAGGDLTGMYPNPQLANETVGSGAFRGENTFTSAGVAVAAGTSAQATVTCPPGFQLMGGGFNWQNNTNGTAVILSSPVNGSQDTKWVVEGRVDTGGTANTISAVANCMQP